MDSFKSASVEPGTLKPVTLKEFVRNITLPAFVKVSHDVHCQATNELYHMRNLNQDELYLHSIEEISCVSAEELDTEYGSKLIPTGKRFSIPAEYRGWFEILSQDGISARPINSVKKLTEVSPKCCLVRSATEGYIRKADGYTSQSIKKGQILTVHETMLVSTKSSDPTVKLFNKHLLHCVDQKERDVYLPVDGVGLFSPIAGHSSIAGAHNFHSLLSKFRLPVVVRLLYGNVSPLDGTQTFNTGVFRLISCNNYEIAFALPLVIKPGDGVLAIPTSTKSVRVVLSDVNSDDLCNYLKKRCNTMIASYKDSIHVGEIQANGRTIQKSIKSWIDVDNGNNNNFYNDFTRSKNIKLNENEEDRLFKEIEDIYMDVRYPNFATRRKIKNEPALIKSNRNMVTSSAAQTAFIQPQLKFSLQQQQQTGKIKKQEKTAVTNFGKRKNEKSTNVKNLSANEQMEIENQTKLKEKPLQPQTDVRLTSASTRPEHIYEEIPATAALPSKDQTHKNNQTLRAGLVQSDQVHKDGVVQKKGILEMNSQVQKNDQMQNGLVQKDDHIQKNDQVQKNGILVQKNDKVQKKNDQKLKDDQVQKNGLVQKNEKIQKNDQVKKVDQVQVKKDDQVQVQKNEKVHKNYQVKNDDQVQVQKNEKVQKNDQVKKDDQVQKNDHKQNVNLIQDNDHAIKIEQVHNNSHKVNKNVVDTFYYSPDNDISAKLTSATSAENQQKLSQCSEINIQIAPNKKLFKHVAQEKSNRKPRSKSCIDYANISMNMLDSKSNESPNSAFYSPQPQNIIRFDFPDDPPPPLPEKNAKRSSGCPEFVLSSPSKNKRVQSLSGIDTPKKPQSPSAASAPDASAPTEASEDDDEREFINISPTGDSEVFQQSSPDPIASAKKSSGFKAFFSNFRRLGMKSKASVNINSKSLHESYDSNKKHNSVDLETNEIKKEHSLVESKIEQNLS